MGRDSKVHPDEHSVKIIYRQNDILLPAGWAVGPWRPGNEKGPTLSNGTRRYGTTIAALLAALIPGVGALAIEEPEFRTVAECGEFSVRRYAATMGAVTRARGDFDAAGNSGFRTLAGYIFGGNRESEKIAMTAPVAQSATDAQADQWQVVFFLPAARAADSLPTPNSDGVAVEPVAERTVAVLGFTGRWVEERFRAREDELRALLAKRGLPADGPAVWARYDPPWTLWFLRRNEIWIELPEEAGLEPGACAGAAVVGSDR